MILSYDKGYGIRDKLSWGGGYGTAASLQGRKGEKVQPPPLYDLVLGRIELAVNDDPENLIVDGMEETYDFILYRADDASRATLLSGTAVAVPLKIL